MAPQHKGIEIRNDSIRIHFTYKGIRCKPTLKGVKPTKANERFAEQKLSTVKYEINNGSFNYAAHFPDCPKAKLFAPERKQISLDRALDDYLIIKQANLAPTTYKSYKNKAEMYVRPLGIGNRLITDFSTSDLEFWVETSLPHLSNKAINEVLIIARGVFKRSCRDLKISNPFDDIDNKPILKQPPDPFVRKEMEKILSTESRFQHEINMAQLAMWSGLSISEYIPLAWEDIDQTDWTIKVQRVKVDSTWKVPKTATRERIIELVDPAIEALQRQKALTFMQKPMTVEVLQRDNKTKIKHTFTPVFLNTQTGNIHSHSAFTRWFREHLRKAKVRYRGPNHCRHSFASQVLTLGISKEWLATQLGHKGTKMIDDHYGKWIPEDAPPMARIISKLLKNDPPVTQAKSESI